MGNSSDRDAREMVGSDEDSSDGEQHELRELDIEQAHHYKVIQNILERPQDRANSLGTLHHLPDECLLRILFYLDTGSLINIGRVSQTFFVLSRDDHLWKLLYHQAMNPNYIDQEDICWDKKKKKRVRGKWRFNCLRATVDLSYRGGGMLTLGEHFLGYAIEDIEAFLGPHEAETHIANGDSYFFFNKTGLCVCCENGIVTSILKRFSLPSCSGPAYEKIVPFPI